MADPNRRIGVPISGTPGQFATFPTWTGARRLHAAPTMVLASVVLRVRSDERREVLAGRRHCRTPSRDADMQTLPLLVDTEDPNLFTLASEWQMAEDADAFFESRAFRTLAGIRTLLREEPAMVMDTVQNRATRLIRER
jgi:quinol monooxygenase YgiN